MTFNDYQRIAVSTAIYPSSARIFYPTLGLTGEAGEVAEKVKKVFRDLDGIFDAPETREAIAKEIGDVLWYAAALARDLGWNLEDIAQGNLQKLRDRAKRNAIQGSGDNR